jgi:hypothetical protein
VALGTGADVRQNRSPVRSRQKPRFLPAANGVMSAKIASLMRSRQKSRLLPAAHGVMSAEIASCDFGQSY